MRRPTGRSGRTRGSWWERRLGTGRARRGERGAVAVIMAAAVVLIVGVAAFAVDLGQQRVARSDMQARADVIALDAARLLDGRRAGDVRRGSNGQPSLADAVAASAARNNVTLGRADSPTGTLIFTTTGPNGEIVPRRDASGALVPVPDDQVPDAVLVQAGGTVDFAFAPVLGIKDGAVSRQAIASKQPPRACLKIGSYVAGVSSADSALLNPLLGQLLRSNINLTAVGYQGLADVDLSVLTLVQKLGPLIGLGAGVGDVDNVLSAPVKVSVLLQAAINALPSGTSDSVVASLGILRTAAVNAEASLGVLNAVKLGDLLGLHVGDGTALGADANLLDLLVTTVQVANGQQAVTVPLTLDTGALGALGAGGLPQVKAQAQVSVVKQPGRGCGPVGTKVTADAASVDLGLGVSLGALSGVLNNALSGLGTSLSISDTNTSNPANANGDLALGLTAHVGAAASTATITAIRCNMSGDPTAAEGLDATVASSVANLQLALDPLKLKLNLLDEPSWWPPALPWPVSVTSELNLSVGSIGTLNPQPSGPMSFNHPPMDWSQPLKFNQASGGSGDLITGLQNPSVNVSGVVNVKVLGINVATISINNGAPTTNIIDWTVSQVVSGLLNIINNTVVPTLVGSLVNPLLTTVNGLLKGPIGHLLGLTIAGSDVFALPHPTCGGPTLIG